MERPVVPAPASPLSVPGRQQGQHPAQQPLLDQRVRRTDRRVPSLPKGPVALPQSPCGPQRLSHRACRRLRIGTDRQRRQELPSPRQRPRYALPVPAIPTPQSIEARTRPLPGRTRPQCSCYVPMAREFVSNKRTRWVGGTKAACQTRSASALGGAYPQGAISSVGRASRLHRECRRFEPVIAHHSRHHHIAPPRRRPGSRCFILCGRWSPDASDDFIRAEARRCLVRGSSRP